MKPHDAQRLSELDGAIDGLSGNLSRLRDAVSALESRLAPVLRESEKDECGEPKPTSSAPLIRAIYGKADEVKDAAAAIEHLTVRLCT